MSAIPGIAGLAGNILNSQYNSALGNTLQQNLAGSQTENVFGSSVWTFINLVRIFQDATLIDELGNPPVLDLENPLGSVEQYKGIEWSATPQSTFYQRLAYLFKVHLPILGEFKVPSPVDFGISDEDGWNGFTRLHVGDVSNLHYKGTIYDVYRVCNHIKYNYGQGFDGKYNPLFFNPASSTISSGATPSPESLAIIENRDFFQTQLESFANWQWRIGVVVSWAFSEYSTLVSTDQAVSGNKAWEMANMAFELAQFLVLHQLGGYQEDWINNIMNKETSLAAVAKLDESQIFASIANIKSMEEQLTTSFNSTISSIESKNLLAQGALDGLLATINSLHEDLENSTKQANQDLVMEYTAKINALEATIAGDASNGITASDQTTYLLQAMKMELERIKLWFAQIEEQQATEQVKTGQPSTQNQIPTTNSEITETNADEATSLNFGVSIVSEIVASQSPLVESTIVLPSDFDLALAQATFENFSQQATVLLARTETAVESNAEPGTGSIQTIQSSSNPPKRVWGVNRALRQIGLRAPKN